MLSLEGVLFVYLAYICLPREVPVSQGLPLGWGLWGLWCGYALERWLDVSFTSEGVVTWRHRFHRASMGGLLLGRVDFIFNKGFARVTFSHLESRGDLGVDGVGRRGDFIAAVLPEFRGVGFAGGLNVWLIRLHGKWV